MSPVDNFPNNEGQVIAFEYQKLVNPSVRKIYLIHRVCDINISLAVRFLLVFCFDLGMAERGCELDRELESGLAQIGGSVRAKDYHSFVPQSRANEFLPYFLGTALYTR